MAMVIRDGGNVARTVTGMIVRDGTNTPRTITQMWIRDPSNTPRLVYSTSPALSLAASPNPTSGGSYGGSPATSDSVTATPTGGTGPYTYAWTRTSYTSGTAPTITSAATAATTFVQTGMTPGSDQSAVFRCTVTDSLAATAYVDVNAYFFDFS